MFHWVKRSYKRKLYAALIVVWLIPLALFIGFDYYTVYTKNAGVIGQYTASNLRIAAQLADNDISTFIAIVNTVAADEEVADILARSKPRTRKNPEDTVRLNHIIQITLAGLPEEVPVHLITPDRDTRYSTTNYYMPFYVDDRGDLFEKMDLIASTEDLTSQVHWRVDGKDSQDTSYVLGRAILHPDSGEIVGYVVLDIYRSYFTNIVDMVASKNGFNTLVTDRELRIIADLENRHYPGYLFQTEDGDLLDGARGAVSARVDGVDHLIYYDTSANTGLYVIEMIPQEYLVKNSLQEIKGHVVFFILIFVLGIFIITYISNRMMTPVKKLELAMGQVGEGEYSTQVAVAGEDEMARLGESFNHMTREIRRLIDENYNKQLALRQAEIKALKAQTNPHFLYNCLNSIDMMLLLGETDVVQQMTQALSRYYRSRVRTEKEIVTIGEEVEEVRNYLAIQVLRFKDRLKVTFEVAEEVLTCCILRLILQPLVENAIVHGVEQYAGVGEIIVQIRRVENRIRVQVLNNGPRESNSRGEGTGMSNTELRLRYRYGENCHLSRSRDRGYTIVRLEFPIEGGEEHVVSDGC
ncbi:MAG: cache domain-containing sensor histidine kinase [Lachnospiraceae bacterium]